ncbi:MAG: cytochrome c oxidase subunit II, partial [Bacteroidia bacterium]|nr:cytochrome c oxidase subunit II [Bacteroidia bacterium]
MDKLEKSIAHAAMLLLVFFILATVYAAFVLDIRVPSCIVDKPLFKEGKVIDLGENRYEVHSVAKMWSFEPAEIEVPLGSTVDIYLTSIDVTHGFHVNKTNVNLMAVPGTVNYARVKFTEPGDYPIICHEYCGTGHQNMKGNIHVMAANEVKKVAQQAPVTDSSPLAKLAMAKG